jgi:hypothetical protein
MADGFAREGFDRDLLFGQAREDAFMRVFLGGSCYLEHKSDQKARDTGCLFIEFETSAQPQGMGAKRPSGVGATESQYWAHEFNDGCWIIVPTDLIKALIARLHPRALVWAGDYNRFHGALLPWRWLLTGGAPAGADDPDQLTL